MKNLCPKCGSNCKQHLYGKDVNQKQRYRCFDCRRVYILDKNYTAEFKKQAVKAYFECSSGRAVGRLMGVSKNTIWNWLEKYCDELEEKAENDVEIAEWDELYTYCKKKKSTHT